MIQWEWRRILLACALVLTARGPAAQQVVHVDDTATGAADGSSWHDAFPALRDGLAAA